MTPDLQQNPVQNLPRLREDLSLLEGPLQENGDPSWLIFDQLRNAYFTIGRQAMALLQAWGLQKPESVLGAAARAIGEELTQEDIEEMVAFLHQNRLTSDAPQDDALAYAAQEKAATPALWKQALHKYLFFRIPLFDPTSLIEKTYPLIAIFFRKKIWALLAGLALFSLFLVGRQWNEFVHTFMYFLTFEGALIYGISLLALMSLHEFGHAFAAYHFKTRVNTIGLAFIVMFPILYTDTTDAWRLKDHRKRVLIDIAGVATEIIIAIIATLFWVFLPDGPARSVAFFAATTSWTLSLLINLNPLMKFDGYYILSDLINLPNLQHRSFALGRWKLREILFGLQKPAPEIFNAKKQNALILFSWATWIYRFFLFLGIALFIHAFFPKIVGIPLFIIEIAWFIGKPIWTELKKWNEMKKDILQTNRSKLTLGLIGLCVIAFFLPLRQNVKAPAVVKPSVQTAIFAAAPGQISEIHIQKGQYVQKGDILFEIDMPEINNDLRQAALNISLLKRQIDRSVDDPEDRQNILILQRSLLTEQERHAGLKRLLKDSILRAPHSGIIIDFNENIHLGRWVNSTIQLGMITDPRSFEIIAMPGEIRAERISTNGNIKFIAADIQRKVMKGNVTEITPVAAKEVTEPALLSIYGGPIAVAEDKAGRLIPDNAVFTIRADLTTPLSEPYTVPGKAIIEAKPQSAAYAVWQRVTAVLIRETDF